MPRRYRKYNRRRKRKSFYRYRLKGAQKGRLPTRVNKLLTNIGTHFFKRTVQHTSLSGSYPVSGTGVQTTFALSDLGSVTDFSNLFDQYRITCIVMRIFPTMNSADNNTTNVIPVIRMNVDCDGGSDTTASELAQKGHKDLSLSGPRTFVMKNLSILREVYRSPTTTSYEPKKKVWLDMATPDIPYYSLNMDWLIAPAGSWSSRVECDYYFTCKGVR